MRTLKKIAAGLLAAALAVGLLTACSDNKVTGTAKSWSLSNTGKVLGIENGLPPQALLTYEVNGTEKYIVNGKAELLALNVWRSTEYQLADSVPCELCNEDTGSG